MSLALSFHLSPLSLAHAPFSGIGRKGYHKSCWTGVQSRLWERRRVIQDRHCLHHHRRDSPSVAAQVNAAMMIASTPQRCMTHSRRPPARVQQSVVLPSLWPRVTPNNN